MQLKYTGVGTRTLNFVIDTTVILILAIIGFKINNWYVYFWRTPYVHFGWFFFGMQFLYYLIWEGANRKSLGKNFTQTRVVNRQGGKPSFGQIVLRSLLRIVVIDLFFIPFTEKTLHDLGSKTELIQE